MLAQLRCGQRKLQLQNGNMFRCICTFPARPVLCGARANTLQHQWQYIQAGLLQCRFSSHVQSVQSRSWNHSFLTHAEVAKRFEEFDKDGDGLITVAECRAAIDRLDREFSDGFVRESIWKWDYNKDGVVDYFEFMHYFLKDNVEEHAGCEHDSRVEFNSVDELLQHCTVNDSTPTTRSLSRQAKAELINSFKLMDTNEDGFLDKQELQVALKSMNPDLSAGQIDVILGDLIAKGDKNGDGLIDLYEFSAFAVQQGLYS